MISQKNVIRHFFINKNIFYRPCNHLVQLHSYHTPITFSTFIWKRNTDRRYLQVNVANSPYMGCEAETIILRCVHFTPFGNPVVPDEYVIIAVCTLPTKIIKYA